MQLKAVQLIVFIEKTTDLIVSKTIWCKKASLKFTILQVAFLSKSLFFNILTNVPNADKLTEKY